MKIEFYEMICREVDRNIDELTTLKHEKLEIEKRLRRLKFEKSNNPINTNNVKKLATLIREKDLNSSDNESPDESDGGMFFLFLATFIFANSSFRINQKR